MTKSKWAQMYASRVGDSYPAYVAQQYRPFLDIITQVTQPNDTVIEAGCGIGTITKIISRETHSADYKAFDKDMAQVMLTEQNLKGIHNIKWIGQGDILDPMMYRNANVIHSHGVLEHFDDRTIARVLGHQQESGARALVHYVPLEGWVTGSYGDERLLSPEHWQRVHNPTDIVLFNEDKDAALVWIL